MKNKVSCLEILIVFFLFFLFVAASAPPVSSVSPSYEKANDLEKSGKYLEAQKIYEGILKDPSFSEGQLKEIRDRLETLNLKILFSRLATDESIFHPVEPGESLYKVAKKYKTTVDLIKKSNGLKSDTIYPGMRLKVVTGVFTIQVDKSENVLMLYLNGKLIKHYSVATGENNGTPAGEFEIVNKLENPTWYKAGAVVPPNSPDNSLGTRWLGFDYPGYGIHGTIEPDSIGHQATSGCIRMLNEEVEELYSLIPAGTKVTISD